MASSTFTYVGTPNANLVCCICRSPFVEPCTTRTCCHTFCYECVARSVSVVQQCPIDRTPLSMQDLAPADPVVRNLVDELVVECTQKSRGCSYTCQRSLMAAHSKDNCSFLEVVCPNGKEGCTVLRKDASGHSHLQDERTDCDEPLPSASTASRNEDEEIAPASPTGPSADAQVKIENESLRMRISALEGIVNVMRVEMQAMQRALGPWYNPQGAFGLGTYERQESPSPSRAEVSRSSYAERPAGPSAAAPGEGAPGYDMPPTEAGVRFNDVDAARDISSYFPPPEVVDRDAYSITPSPAPWRSSGPPERPDDHPTSPSVRRSRSGHPPSLSSAPAGPSYAHAASSYPTHPPTALSPVFPAAPFSPTDLAPPPLDPRTPLPDTLASLHASLGSLAGAVSSLAVARAAETVHVGEELRGVRASMHGMRMQLHDVLTVLHARDGPLGHPGMEEGGEGALGMPPFAPGIVGISPWLAYAPRPFGPPMPMPMHPKPPMHPVATKL